MDEKKLKLLKALHYWDVLYALIDLLKTHSELNQAEYERNPSYNSSHPAYKSEEQAINVLQEHFGCSIIEIMDMQLDDVN